MAFSLSLSSPAAPPSWTAREESDDGASPSGGSASWVSSGASSRSSSSGSMSYSISSGGASSSAASSLTWTCVAPSLLESRSILSLRGRRRRGGRAALLAGAALGLSLLLVLCDEMSAPLLYDVLRGGVGRPTRVSVYIPPSLDPERKRRMSLNLGGASCRWQPPSYEVPDDVDFRKTVVVGFPGDKRTVYLQMEALAGWPTKDEWDLRGLGMSNHLFIKASYPHHKGIWGWGDAADQVVMMVPSIRRSMVEYHDILWDLGYTIRWEDILLLRERENLHEVQPDLIDYYEWRDSRLIDEVCWYGWFIDYWMEGGLQRDVFTHKLTTPEHWQDLVTKPFHTREELAYEKYVDDEAAVSPSYDPHCAGGEISRGCEPVAVISVDRLMDYTEGASEAEIITSVLAADSRTERFVIDPEAWDCIWAELVENEKGPRVVSDGPGHVGTGRKDAVHNFSAEVLREMLRELDRLVSKYSGQGWSDAAAAARLVEILEGHRGQVAFELHEVSAGARALADGDFLGPSERARRRELRPGERAGARRTRDNLRYFAALEQKRLERRRGGTGGEGADGSVSNADFIEILTGALMEVRTLDASGEIDKGTAAGLIERIRRVAAETKVGLGK